MPKFEVNIVKTVWEECWIEVEAVNEEAAEAMALALVQAEQGETVEWTWKETIDYDAIKTELIEPPKQAAE
jgi:plastocyanin